MAGRGGGEASGKYAPHAYCHARPWDRFHGKQVGKKEVSAREIFRPGHKANPVLDGPAASGSSGAIGGGLNFDPARQAGGVSTSRRQFGTFGLPVEEDVLGPVDLAFERSIPPPPQRKKLEEPPPDTLRWNPDAQAGGRNLAAASRRRAAELAAAEQEQAKVSAPAPRPLPVRAERELTQPPNQRTRTEAGILYEEKMRARAKIEAERAEEAERAAAVRRAAEQRGYQPEYFNPVLAKAGAAKVAALSDPRVQAAIVAQMNEPNALAREQYKSRNTTRVSGERKF